jgi:hypothetical protein
MVNFLFHFFGLLLEEVKKVVFKEDNLSVPFYFLIRIKLTNNGTLLEIMILKFSVLILCHSAGYSCK